MNRKTILLDHGSGGKKSFDMIFEMILPAFENPFLSKLNDGAELSVNGSRLAFSTDSFVVDPLFFPGGNIGDLAVNGTINDLSMCGATPLYLSAGFIVEEGFSMDDFEKIIKSMALAAREASVQIVTGDTKVVPRGAADKIFINTSGIGLILPFANVSSENARPGDKVIISGTIADHGVTVLTHRGSIPFDVSLKTDSAPLNRMVNRMFMTSNEIHTLRDPTRGGIGTALNEIARASGVGIEVYEDKIPIKDNVRSACELLGLDPLYIANEGKLLAFVSPDVSEAVLQSIRDDEFGKDACIIGEVVSRADHGVFLNTRIGGKRIVRMLSGEQLPRIC